MVMVVMIKVVKVRKQTLLCVWEIDLKVQRL